jgi:neutral ceramidase
MIAKRFVIAACLAVVSCASTGPRRDADPPGVISVGVAQIDITPGDPIRLTGYGNRTAPSERVAQRLRAKALAFGDDRARPAVLISADLIGVPRRMTDEIARRLQKAGIQQGHLAISATHTHTGPTLAGTLPFIFSEPLTAEQQGVIDRYSQELVDKLERVALAALADRRPSRVAWGLGTASFAANRRVLKDGRWVAFGVTPDGAVDRDLPILVVRGADGALRAALVSYACHATTLEGKDNYVHGDWPGVAQELIEQRHPGAIALVTIGAGADANPNPRGGGLPDVDRHAREVAGEVDRLLGSTLRPVGTAPIGRLRSLELPLAPIRGRAEWEAQARQKGAPGLYAQWILKRLDSGERIATTVSYPVQTWTFGNDLVMVFLGGEVVADYGLRLKRELDATRLWVNAYSNDVAFYVPSRRMIPEGGYEVIGSMVYYGHPAALAESTEDQIVGAVRELLPPGFEKR